MPWLGPQLDEPAAPILFWAVAVYTLARWIAGPARAGRRRSPCSSLVLVDYVFVGHAAATTSSDVVFVLALIAAAVRPRPDRAAARPTRSGCCERTRSWSARGGARRAGPDRPRAARRHRALGQRHGRADRRRAGPRAHRPGPRRGGAAPTWPTPAAGRWPRPGRLLHVIRDDADELGLAPAPGLADLPALVERLPGQRPRRSTSTCRRAAAGAAGRRGRLGLPDRAGGADQRAALRRRPARRAARVPAPPAALVASTAANPRGRTRRARAAGSGLVGHGRAGLRCSAAARPRRHRDGPVRARRRRCRWRLA